MEGSAATVPGLSAGRIAYRLERPVVLLAAGTWLALAAQLADMALSGLGLSLYHVAQSLLAATGLAACAGLLAGWAGGRRVLVGAAAAYLVLAVARLFVVYTWKFLETDSWPVAVWNTFVMQWLFMVHMTADGSLAFGVLMLFYEWLMPLAQAVVLAALCRPRNQPV